VTPGRHLDPLVHRLGRAVQSADPVDDPGRFRAADRDTEALDPGRLGVPQVQAERPLVAERGVEHALCRQDPPAAYLVGGAVGHHGDVVAVALEAEGELKPGLTGADDEYLRQ
jgi:hypothetical protein